MDAEYELAAAYSPRYQSTGNAEIEVLFVRNGLKKREHRHLGMTPLDPVWCRRDILKGRDDECPLDTVADSMPSLKTIMMMSVNCA